MLVGLALLTLGGYPALLSAQQAFGAAAPASPVPAPNLPPEKAEIQAQRDKLQNAVVKRDPQALRALIRSGVKLDFNYDELLPRGRSFESPLTQAIYRGHLDIARILLESGANANRKDGDNRSPIHQARSADAVKLLKEFGADVNALDGRGRSAATNALERGDLAAFDMLIAQGVRLDTQAKGPDLLAQAIETKRPELVGPLLERGIDPRAPPTQALWLLIENGDTATARLLVKAGADVNVQKNRDWLLTRALFRKRWELAEVLVDAGANVQLADQPKCGESFRDCYSIQLARLASFNPPLLGKLKAKGLDLNAAGKDGHTALTSLIVDQPMAVRAVSTSGVAAKEIPAPDNVARAKALLDLGADSNRKYRDLTPLMLAIVSQYTARDMADMLIPFGARIDFEAVIPKPEPDKPAIAGYGRLDGSDVSQLLFNHQGVLTGMKVGSLTWAVLNSRPDIAQRLLMRDKVIGAADRDLIYFAATVGHWDLVISALSFTKEVNAANRADVTPLMLAADAGHIEAVRALLAAGAKVNVRSDREWPPLLERNILAALAGHQSRPKLVGGYTALKAAREKGHAGVVQLLAAAGGKE